MNAARSRVGISSRTLLVALALSGAGGHAARGQNILPSPPERPAEFKQAPPATPQPRPAELGGVSQSPQPTSPEKKNGEQSPPSNGGTGQPPAPATQPAEEAALPQDEVECRDRLAATGASFKPLPPIVEGACGAPFPLEVSMLPDGVAVSPPITLTCRATEALAKWTRDSVLENPKRG